MAEIRSARDTYGTVARMRAALGGHLRSRGVVPWRWRGAAVPARVEHGRWLADCPAAGCAGAEEVDPAWGSFLCGTCGCEVVAPGVSFPPAVLLVAAARILGARPVEHRHWWPERAPVEELDRDNVAHGLPGLAELRGDRGRPADGAAPGRGRGRG